MSNFKISNACNNCCYESSSDSSSSLSSSTGQDSSQSSQSSQSALSEISDGPSSSSQNIALQIDGYYDGFFTGCSNCTSVAYGTYPVWDGTFIENGVQRYESEGSVNGFSEAVSGKLAPVELSCAYDAAVSDWVVKVYCYEDSGGGTTYRIWQGTFRSTRAYPTGPEGYYDRTFGCDTTASILVLFKDLNKQSSESSSNAQVGCNSCFPPLLKEYTMTVSGMSGSLCNGTTTVTNTGGCNWQGTIGTCTAKLSWSGSEWVARIEKTSDTNCHTQGDGSTSACSPTGSYTLNSCSGTLGCTTNCVTNLAGSIVIS